jgi:hypothetical protein
LGSVGCRCQVEDTKWLWMSEISKGAGVKAALRAHVQAEIDTGKGVYIDVSYIVAAEALGHAEILMHIQEKMSG